MIAKITGIINKYYSYYIIKIINFIPIYNIINFDIISSFIILIIYILDLMSKFQSIIS